LTRRAIGDDSQAAAIEVQVDAELKTAVAFATKSPEPDVAEFLASIEDG
jgi:TPP-dependent pyruvate/acetoin dehydrogenase alpha subunit